METLASETTYSPGDQVFCYQNMTDAPADELAIDTATITGDREEWKGNPVQGQYGYPIRDSLGREGWIFEDQIINQN